MVSALWSSVGSRLAVVRDNCLLVVRLPDWEEVRQVECGDNKTSTATPSPLYSTICRDDRWLWFSPGTEAAWLAFLKLRSGDNPDDVPTAGLEVADITSDTGGVIKVELGEEKR